MLNISVTFKDMYDIYFVSMWQTECCVHLNLSSENIDSDDDLSAVSEERDDSVPAVPGTSCASSNDHVFMYICWQRNRLIL